MKLLTNYWFHFAVLAACAVVMVIEVIATGSSNLSEMTIIGKVAGYIFLADLVGFALYMIVYRMILKGK